LQASLRRCLCGCLRTCEVYTFKEDGGKYDSLSKGFSQVSAYGNAHISIMVSLEERFSLLFFSRINSVLCLLIHKWINCLGPFESVLLKLITLKNSNFLDNIKNNIYKKISRPGFTGGD